MKRTRRNPANWKEKPASGGYPSYSYRWVGGSPGYRYAVFVRPAGWNGATPSGWQAEKKDLSGFLVRTIVDRDDAGRLCESEGMPVSFTTPEAAMIAAESVFALKPKRTKAAKPNPRCEHPIAAAQRLGEQFHRWQGAGLRKAVRLVMPRRNPTYSFTTAADGCTILHYDGSTWDLGHVGARMARQLAEVIVKDRDNLNTLPATARAAIERLAKNPAGWQHAEASAAVRRATQTGNTADRQAAASALARLASKRRPSRIPNPRRRNPADPIVSKVTALRRAIRKAVASQEADGDRSVYLPVYRMLDKIEDFAWRNSMPFDGSPLRAEITVAIGEGQARRRAYLDAEGDRIDAARRAALNTPEARYLAELRQGYGR